MKQLYAPEHDTKADSESDIALHRELLRYQVKITPQELGEHLTALTTDQFDQVMQLIVETSDEKLQYVMRELVCVKLVDDRVKELMK